MKKPVSFFLVEYDPTDPFSFLLALVSFAPPFLVAIQTTVFLTLFLLLRYFHHTPRNLQILKLDRADGLAGKLLLGQLANELLNLLLKNTLKHPRPASMSFSHCYTDYGLPSSHSQFMAFLAVVFPGIVKGVCGALNLHWFVEILMVVGCYFGTFLIAFGRLKINIYN